MLPILVSTHISSTAALSCLGPSGTAVDWWFMIKQPRWGDRSRSQCIGNCEGTAYAFVTSESPSSWQTGENITSTSSLLGVQLAGIYSGAVPNYVMYNDQLPNGTWTEVYGHSKGFFAYDATSAYFVQHSIPKFPNFVSGGYLYGSGQLYYGQHAFCMSVTPSALDEIASIMLWSYPLVYDYALTDTGLTNVASVVAGQNRSGTHVTTVSTSWASLTVLGKANDAGIDMLDSLVAPHLELSLVSQSWLNSGGPIGGYCPASGYDVVDELSLTLPLPTGAAATHVTYEDHSKWAVANSSTSNWWCANDNNHVESQEKRSGLSVCWQDANVAKLLRTACTSIGGCGAPSPPSPGPGPSGSCCYYHSTSCTAGQTCCTSSGKSYSSASSCARYGATHHCVWEAANSTCVVGSSEDA